MILKLFLTVYAGSYLLSVCPYFDGSLTPFGLAIMAVLGTLMFLQRLRYISPGFVPRVTAMKSAVFITGCDQSFGLAMAARCASRGILVFAGVDDPESSQAEWLRAHLIRYIHVLRVDPRSDTDAPAAARFVREHLDDRTLIAAVYSSHTVPKESEILDLNDVRRCIEVNAMGAVKVADAFAPLLKEHNSRYVILTDMAGRTAIPTLQSYCMSQAVALQFTEVIRKKLEKDNVSVHVVEQLLQSFRKAQANRAFPETCLDDGKIITESQADEIIHPFYLTINSLFLACLSENPKAHYLPSYVDLFMDKIIRYSPPCLRDRVVNYYFQSIPRRDKISS